MLVYLAGLGRSHSTSRRTNAKKQVQDIALKAIEGAAGANALAHINKIAMEQAKQRSPQG
jgi:colicin import membrane protein